jgi:two-component system CheB/CheR fusion protein
MLRRLEKDNRRLKADLQNTLERCAMSTEELKTSYSELPAPTQALFQLFKGMRILTVDDDPESLAMFAELLRLEGASVDSASGSLAALELLAKRSYDLVISDLSMPGIDGHAFISRLRETQPQSPVIAIALSGYGRPIDVQKATAAGFDGHLAKPASLEALKALWERVWSAKGRSVGSS